MSFKRTQSHGAGVQAGAEMGALVRDAEKQHGQEIRG